jgi:hypothetical protein
MSRLLKTLGLAVRLTRFCIFGGHDDLHPISDIDGSDDPPDT